MRSANFCESDKLLLINIINGPANSDATTSYVSLIDCKELDKISLERKNAAWAAITRAFNLRSYASRAESQLRMLWKNLKSRNRRFAVTSDDEHFPRSHGTIDDSPISKSRPGNFNAFFLFFLKIAKHPPIVDIFSCFGRFVRQPW